MNQKAETHKFLVITGLLSHKLVSRLAFDAKALGLKVDYSHDGGWVTRRHSITFTGPKEAIAKVARYIDKITKESTE